MHSSRSLVCFFVSLYSAVAFAQLETDPLPPDPPIDIGGVITTSDAEPELIAPPTSDFRGKYSRSMRARHIRDEPTIRSDFAVNLETESPPSLALWDTTPQLASDSRPPQLSATPNGQTAKTQRTASLAAYEIPTNGSPGFETAISNPVSAIVDPQPYIPAVEHIPSVGYESYATSNSFSQPVQYASASFVTSDCTAAGACTCGGGCFDAGYGGGGLLGGCLAGYGQANALPLGAATNAYFDQQVYNGERSQYTLYHFDFFDQGSAEPSQLNRAGRSKLAKLVTPTARRSYVAHQIIVQPVLNRPSLSEARRLAVLQFLSSRLGVNYGDSQVILAEPDYRGLRGVEAVEIDRNQLQNTRSFGSLGGGAQLGGAQGGGQAGGSQNGGGLQGGAGSQSGRR